MEEVKIERMEPITFDEQALLLAEFAGGLGRVFVCKRMTREELEAMYPGIEVPR